ncbi:MAG TPA: hypothetical protein VLZ89_03845 [Anaerolineales bacterium]|nr:hypothetical protein [Anaerolineales bacterium]
MPAMEYEVAALRQRIAHLEGQVAFLYRHFGVTFVPEAGPGDDPRIIEGIRKGDTLGAIKVYRDINKVGLEEARAAVDEIRGRLGL